MLVRSLMVLAAASLGLAGCALELEIEGEYEVGSSTHELLINNDIRLNGYKWSGLFFDDRTWGQDWTARKADLESLLAQGNAENDKGVRYLVECALPAGQSVWLSGGGWHSGRAGLAPSFDDQVALPKLQSEALTGCLLSRINANGQTVTLSMRGHGLSANESYYTFEEAAFFGDFRSNKIYVCGGNGLYAWTGAVDQSALHGRLCGAGACPGLPHAGDCADVCAYSSAAKRYTSCSYGGTWTRPITIYMHQSTYVNYYDEETPSTEQY